ncbi:MAG: hypothetical protein KDB80_08255 [Planctomycetes bacterium]|nr:hypothetical protein [Planctomycetota bacterium]
MPSRLRRITTQLLLALAALTIADQGIQWTVLRTGTAFGHRIAPFDPPLFTDAQRATLDRLATEGNVDALGDVVFDAELGWCTPPIGTPSVDRFGGRLSSSERPTTLGDGVRRIAVFGCSFTYGSEVAGSESWPALLESRREDLQVLNFGVPGFGADQALLRMRRVVATIDVDEIWLGLLPATALRLVSVYRPALRHYTNTVAFKPRFRMQGDELVLVRNPAPSIPELVAIVRSPERFATVVRTDSFMSRWPAAYAPDGTSPSHWFATSRLCLTMLERGGREWASRFADRGDEVRQLADAIVARFAWEASVVDAEFRLVILPDRESLTGRRASAAPAWQDFVTRLREHEVPCIDVTMALERTNAAADDSIWALQGHYSAAGNRVVADELAASVPR